METYGDYIKVAKEESENSEEIQKKMKLPLISRRFNHLWKHRKGRRSNEGPSNAKGRCKSTTGQKERKEAQKDLQEEQAVILLMDRIGTESEVEPSSEDKSISEVFSIFTPSDIYMPLYLRY